jgi:hypothetical protein
LHLSVIDWPIDGAGDGLKMVTSASLSEFFSNLQAPDFEAHPLQPAGPQQKDVTPNRTNGCLNPDQSEQFLEPYNY